MPRTNINESNTYQRPGVQLDESINLSALVKYIWNSSPDFSDEIFINIKKRTDSHIPFQNDDQRSSFYNPNGVYGCDVLTV